MPTQNAKPLAPFKDAKREQAFRTWYAMQAQKFRLNPDPDDPRHYYDFRRAFQSGFQPSGHWPSEFRLAGNPDREVDRMDTLANTPIRTTLYELLKPRTSR
jgi:hypothetical protein